MKERLTLKRKAELTADKVIEAWSEGMEGLIRIAAKRRKPMSNFNEVYVLAREQIMRELIRDKKRLKEEYTFFEEM